MLLIVGSLSACDPGAPGPGLGDRLELSTVPTPPAYVSGATALMMLEMEEDVDAGDVTVEVNGEDQTDRFRPAPRDPLGRDRNALLGLVPVRRGSNEVVAFLDGQAGASLLVTAHPIRGPIFSGEPLEPFFCLGEMAPEADGTPRAFEVGNGEEIAESDPEAGCAIETRVDYLYMPGTTASQGARDGSGSGGDGAGGSDAGAADRSLQPLADPADLPEDVARITTTTGETVPFVVRLETGSVNRAVYQTASLVDPEDSEPDPWSPPRGWNGRLIYTFGGGCEAGYFQGTRTGGVLQDDLLAKGYAVASSTLNVNAQGGCNDPLSAETAMMVKEIFAERYGPPVHTMGLGGSGGAMQQLLIGGAYPGILDGLLPSLVFPDALTYFIDTPDCRLLLRRYFRENPASDAEKTAVGGWSSWDLCENSLGPRTNRLGPGDCPSAIPAAARYDPVANPGGIRCSILDAMHNVLGTAVHEDVRPAPNREFGRSPNDNVGVQYGLLALNEGRISKGLFLDLNEQIGGWDINFEWQPERHAADPAVVRIPYETGRITSGKGGLSETPIIDDRTYLDDVDNFHASYYSFVMRERLIRDAGHADNYVLLRHGRDLSLTDTVVAAMDEWLTAIGRDTLPGTRAEKVVRNRPADLVDACWDADGQKIVEPQTFEMDRIYDNTQGRCNTLYPPHAGPRMIAGGPLTNDVEKCRLKPLDPTDYDVEFTEEEWDRLERIFPEGVCDWSRPGVGMEGPRRTWLSYGPSPVNRYQVPQ
ncbi:MAG: DUF6351 family protein [Longimicrobiales bacterium]|nr:DUF6351 family protein [Longimicrobiales bacterium]